ncbi:GPI transamidase component Gpi16p [[Candida] anglica]
MLIPVYLAACLVATVLAYDESLYLKPLPRNKLMASWEFEVESLPSALQYYTEEEGLGQSKVETSHYKYFPRALGPIIQSTNTRELHLRFTQGWWDSDAWGTLPANGTRSGGTGVEVWAVIEAPDVSGARKSWDKLANSLSGFFCASLNFIDDSITTFPKHASESKAQDDIRYLSSDSNKLYFLRASLPSEPICTENLTPFLKLLPTRGKSGVSSLLEGHKVFDSLWHGMSIDVTSVCDDENESTCHLSMHQSVNSVIDLIRSIRKRTSGGIPKPVPGDDLRCDPSKPHNAWQCFPLGDPTDLTWSLDSILGRKIVGPAFTGDSESSKVYIDINPEFYNVSVIKSQQNGWSVEKLSPPSDGSNIISYNISDSVAHDIKFETTDSTMTSPINEPPLKVSRSLTGYSQDQGGFRVSFTNPSTEKIEFVYYEVLPWYMRLYFNTLSMVITNNGPVESRGQGSGQESDYIKNRYYKPAIDRQRPSHLELTIELPPQTSMTLTYQFDKSLLLYAEYPPDANHGFTVEPAVVTVLGGQDKKSVYELRTTSLLVTLPTPDFSMPYNVIILTSTVMALAFGSVFNLLIRKVVTEEESETLASQSKFAVIAAAIKRKIGRK